MDKRQKILEINKQQAEFYNKDLRKAGNIFTVLWRKGRRRLNKTKKRIGLNAVVDDLHKKWMGDLSNKQVLDLGCYAGNPLSLYLARSSKNYLGIDLSDVAIKILQTKLREHNISNAEAKTIDFLSEEFKDEKFDVIYARAVAHHFQYFDVFLKALREHLNPHGMVVMLDPMETFMPLKVMRMVYRIFQSDKKWEWPFTKRNFVLMKKFFNISQIQGILGQAKWAFPLAFFDGELATKKGIQWVEKDMKTANQINNHLWNSLQVTVCLTKLQQDLVDPKSSGL